MEDNKTIPQLPKNISNHDSIFSFKYSLPGNYTPPKATNPNNRYRLEILRKIPKELAKECDPYNLCLLPISEYEKVYNKLSHPYYLVIGLNTFKARLCTIAPTNERFLASPSITNFFINDKEVTIKQYINFIYKPIPYATKLTILPINFIETDSYPIINKPKYMIESKQIILPGDMLYNTKNYSLNWQGEFSNIGIWKIISITYKGLHNKELTTYDLNSQPGFFLTDNTEIILIPSKTHEYISYQDIEYRSSVDTNIEWEKVECIDKTVNEVFNYCKEQKEMNKQLMKVLIRGNDNIELVINLLAKKLSLKICKRDISLCLTLNEVVDKLGKGLDVSPSIVWIKNVQEMKIILEATFESQKIPEKQLQSELMSSLKSLYLELEKRLHKEVIIIYTTNTIEDLPLNINDYEIIMSSLSKSDKEYLLNMYSKGKELNLDQREMILE